MGNEIKTFLIYQIVLPYLISSKAENNIILLIEYTLL